MNTLKPHSLPKVNFLLEAEARLSQSYSDLQFVYRLMDKSSLFATPTENKEWSQIPRSDGLWNHTCFEAFLNPVDTETYYEFNFSLKPAWNCYYFEAYRQPQPAKSSHDFLLKSIRWDQSTYQLTVELKNNSKFKKFNIGLTAVLEEKAGDKHYCALVHADAKPDFHLRKSFTLIR